MGRAKKDPNAPKRPQTAFFLFAADHRPAAKKSLPEGARVSEVAKKLGVMWKEADAKTKEKYQSQAEENKAKYAEEMEAYRNGQGVTANDSE
ncbi:Oidioi.mRNA.OKI2018_I69.chr2.g7131.t1.cds [Oikopleura dioica]|uniref:Oidioi.mRNA.OKI2018_I69.chr2.g7131.t1.cds n=1 Tax=Oikopleura dioica TaxID=34765 RepID=A0ABN7T9Z6_OIKDI|nr:Oidioi.mRNA.OKI2018_I69.chr2.g7131.t1.cds [Oikopleura dioica]